MDNSGGALKVFHRPGRALENHVCEGEAAAAGDDLEGAAVVKDLGVGVHAFRELGLLGADGEGAGLRVPTDQGVFVLGLDRADELLVELAAGEVDPAREGEAVQPALGLQGGVGVLAGQAHPAEHEGLAVTLDKLRGVEIGAVVNKLDLVGGEGEAVELADSPHALIPVLVLWAPHDEVVPLVVGGVAKPDEVGALVHVGIGVDAFNLTLEGPIFQVRGGVDDDRALVVLGAGAEGHAVGAVGKADDLGVAVVVGVAGGGAVDERIGGVAAVVATGGAVDVLHEDAVLRGVADAVLLHVASVKQLDVTCFRDYRTA